VVPEKNEYFPESVSQSYQKIHSILRESLKDHLPVLEFTEGNKGFKPRSTRLCFEEPTCFDIGIEGKKIIGSSQRRKGAMLLHQTAMFLSLEPLKASDLLIQGFESSLGISMETSSLTSQETKRVEEIINSKYLRSEYSFTAPHPVLEKAAL